MGYGGVRAPYAPIVLAAKKGTLERDIVQRGWAIVPPWSVSVAFMHLHSLRSPDTIAVSYPLCRHPVVAFVSISAAITISTPAMSKVWPR